MKRNIPTVVILLSMTLVAPRPASASDNDIHLVNIYNNCKDSNPTDPEACRKSDFKKLANELGTAMGPVFLSSGQTLGLSGFEVTYSISFANIKETASYWKTTEDNVTLTGGADNYLIVNRLSFRKGLPFSFEFGGNVAQLLKSEALSIGGELKWSFNEGFYYIPDVAVRATVNRVLGTKDIDMTTAGFDVAMSKSFAIAGVSTLTPYVGYDLLGVNAASHVIDPTPNKTDDQDQDYVFTQVKLAQNVMHRGFTGLKFHSYVFDVGGEIEFGGVGVAVYSIRVGLTY